MQTPKAVQVLGQLSVLDWLVFFLVILITLISVLYGNRRKEKSDSESTNYLDLILMGRQLTLPLFVATLVATWYGGIFGVTKMAFNKGIYNFLTQGVFWYFTYLLFAFFMVKQIRNSKAQTLPDLIGLEFGDRSRKISAFLNLINVIPISYAISVGLFLQILFGGGLLINTTVGVGLVMLYSTHGGFRAVVYSDLIQFFVMIIAVVLILVFSISTYGGLDYLQANLPANHLSITGGESFANTLVWGIIALSTLVDPNFYQRCLAAKDYKVAKKGIIIATVIWILFDICTTAGALYARASMPHLESKTAYLYYAVEILPSGLRGLILAGILATIISTLDSYIFLGATTIVNDIYHGKKIKSKIKAHHLSVFIIGIFSILFSYVAKGNIIKVWKLLGGLSSSCLLIPLLVGRMFKKEIGDKEFFISSMSGISSIIIWEVLGTLTKLPPIDDLYIGCIGSIMPLMFFIVKKKLSSN